METEEVKEIKEEKFKLDFPFYNDNPKIKPLDIVILAIMPILFTIYTFLPNNFLGSFGAYVFCISEVAAFLIVARGKISLIVKKPKIRDFVRIIITTVLHLIFSIGIAMILQYVFNYETKGNDVLQLDMGFSFWCAIIFQLFGEEMYKILIFLVVLILMYKFTKKKGLSVTIATIVSLFCFAMLHKTTYSNMIQILLIQGVATIFNFYNYLKTKNILTSYLQHLIFDAVPFILAMTNVIQ